MSRTLRKAIESTKQKKENSIRLSDEGISSLYEVPELCTLTLFVCILLKSNDFVLFSQCSPHYKIGTESQQNIRYVYMYIS